MDTVAIYLRDAMEEEVIEFLQRAYPFQEGPPWVADVQGDACLYIRVNGDASEGAIPDEWATIVSSFGAAPAMAVTADVSGRHYLGNEHVRRFVTELLSRFDGAAVDGYTPHLWSLPEILSGQQIEGHPFFDQQGWHDELIERLHPQS